MPTPGNPGQIFVPTGLKPAEESPMRRASESGRKKSVTALSLNHQLNSIAVPKSPEAVPAVIQNNRRKSLATVTRNLEIAPEEVGSLSLSPDKVPLSPDQLRQQSRLIKQYSWAVTEADRWDALASRESGHAASLEELGDAPRIRRGRDEVEIKTWNFYKKNWTQGRPGKQTAAWEDMSRIPLTRRSLFVRPDLAIGSMNSIMDHLVSEHETVARQRQETMARRQAQRHALRVRHEAALVAQHKLGVAPPSSYGTLLHTSASDGRLQIPALFVPQSAHLVTSSSAKRLQPITRAATASPTLSSFSTDL